MNTANEASETIQNTTGAMRNMRDNLGASNENDEASGFLSSTSEKLNAEASEIRRQASKNRGKIDKGLKIMYIQPFSFCLFLPLNQKNLIKNLCSYLHTTFLINDMFLLQKHNDNSDCFHEPDCSYYFVR